MTGDRPVSTLLGTLKVWYLVFPYKSVWLEITLEMTYIYICQSRDGNLVELPTLPVEIAIVISTGRDANHDLYQYKLVELQTLPVEIAIVISTSRECNCDLY